VNFLGMLDAVDSAPFFPFTSQVPRNVDSLAHAISDPNLGSRWYFNQLNDGDRYRFNRRRCEIRDFWATHAAVGGAPWSGDDPKDTSKSVDQEVSKLIEEWFRQEAAHAGVNLR